MNVQIAMDGVVNEECIDAKINIFSNQFEKQINAASQDLKGEVVCFTGNRPTSLPWRYNEDCELCNEFKIRLKYMIKLLIEQGVKKFITGMAMGFDMIIAEVILGLKEEGCVLELECVVPCLNQTEGWNIEYKDRYKKVIDKADKVTYTALYNYFNGCYAIRNKHMVDSADVVIGCQFKPSGGTMSTIDYARKKNKKLLIINY